MRNSIFSGPSRFGPDPNLRDRGRSVVFCWESPEPRHGPGSLAPRKADARASAAGGERRVMRFLLAALFLLLSSSTFGQEFATRIFQLSNRPAEATVEMVRPLLSPNGTVMAETRLQKLIVRDFPDRLAEVEKLLAEIDQPAPQVRIHVAMSGVSPTRGHNAGVAVHGNVKHPTVDLTAQAHSGASAVDSQQNLVVMSGERGVITMARDLVTIDPYFQFASQRGLLAPNLIVQSVSTGFAVEPVVVGDVVRMTITPWLGFIGPSGRSEVMLDEASSTVALKSGQEMTIASGSSRQEFQGAAYGLIFGSTGGSTERSASITVRPEIFDYP